MVQKKKIATAKTRIAFANRTKSFRRFFIIGRINSPAQIVIHCLIIVKIFHQLMPEIFQIISNFNSEDGILYTVNIYPK